MNWMVWLFGAMFGTALERCLNRFLLRDNPGYWEYLIGYNIGALLFIIPFNASHASFTSNKSVLAILLLSGICWFLCCLFGFIADTTTAASISGILAQLQLVFIFFGGVVFLGENITLMRVLGIALIIAGLTVLAPKVRLSMNSGVAFKIAGTLFGALALLLDKYLINYFDASIISITGYSIPLLIAIVWRPKSVVTAFKESQKIRFFNVWMGVLGCATYNMLLQSFKSAPISVVFPIYQLNLILTLIAGYVLLKERDHVWQKVVCTLLVILGTVILQ